MNISNVLVVDDEPLMRDFLGETLERLGCEVKFAMDGQMALKMIEENSFDIVFTDLKLPKLSGLEVIKKTKAINPTLDIVMMTAYGTIETAIEAMKYGACDYLLKPFTPDYVEVIIEKISNNLKLKAQNDYYRKEIEESAGFGEIVGATKQLKEIYKTIKKVADSKASVLISGESGTGKELVARAIHYNSDRRNKAFIKLNCAALPSNLIESELFGHERGAFTGAINQRIGRFELADGGTIFLDEISEIDISLQSKLLRVLQERELERIGSAKTVKVDVRVLASTNRDLKKEIEKNKFREDLFYRLNVIPVHLPPLRERKEDIKLLSEHFLKRFLTENKKSPKRFSEDALRVLLGYSWPGNVRELENVVERAIVLDRSDVIDGGDLGILPDIAISSSGGGKEDSFYIVGKKLEDIEKNYILQTLKYCDDNRTKSADMLGISIRTLRNKLNEYKIGDGT